MNTRGYYRPTECSADGYNVAVDQDNAQKGQIFVSGLMLILEERIRALVAITEIT